MTKIKTQPRWPLYLFFSVLYTSSVFADYFSQETFKTHLRWNLIVPKEQVSLKKEGDTLFIESTNLELFDKLAAELEKTQRAEGYIEKLTIEKGGFPSKPARAVVELKNSTVELFSFYRDLDKKWILDFWINTDLVPSKAASLQKPLQKPLPVPKSEPVKVTELTPAKSLLEIVKVEDKKLPQKNPEYRDFRYGASFFWNYEPLLPPIEKDIILESKIPDSLYPIKDRELLDDEKEAHLQLTINLYRQEKWGLMNKSLTLYEKKYGRDANFTINEWIRANAILRSNLTKKDKNLQASAMNILSNLIDLSKDYEVKRACYRYLIQYRMDKNDYFKALELSKKFFVEARGEFDHDMVILSSNIILNTLARLRQDERISEFLSDKKLNSLLAPQMLLAYTSYALLKEGRTDEIIRRFKEQEKGLAKPVHPAILFNVAESHFREANYDEAIEMFDEFLANYSYMLEAPAARLRVALMFELLDRPAAQTISLYKNSIDRSPNAQVRYEAKLRYVGFIMNRKLFPTVTDLESEVFLEQSADEKSALTPELKKLLWLTRLRTMITKKEFSKALSYLATIPLDTLKPSERRVFEGDGAEIVYGLVQQDYFQEEYTKAVKTWEVYKDKYDSKVAANPYMNFIIAESFIKLDLYESFERAYAQLKGMKDVPEREYPLWIERTKTLPLQDMVEELALIKAVANKNWDQARAKLASYPVSLRASMTYTFYKAQVDFQTGNWGAAAQEYENALVKQDRNNRLTPRQMADVLMGYVESLYNLKDIEKFKSVVKALVKDIQQSKSAPILNVAERVNYLLIESLVAEETKIDWKEIEDLVVQFKEQFIKSPYTSRIEYLLGLSLLRNGKLKEGRVVLERLIKKEEVPLYVREMARTELSDLTLKEKRL